MALYQRGRKYFGDSQVDIRGEIHRYSQLNEYVAQYFADAICACGSRTFRLALDDNEGVAIRICFECNSEHAMGDSEDYLDDATPEERACPCGSEAFEITLGVALYDDSADVRWLYVGCRCPKCGQTAVYGDWKNEFIGYQALLKRV